ncbi:MAG: plasmid pRiA4b ORF-3 family protein [Firmicutes bacterium]|nr:plasmid pRiA4b ORF-3 family protein [Bacillota bacterium]
MKAYRIRIALKELPNVWREVVVPSGISLQTLHYVIQYAMGWQDIQYHSFRVEGDPTEYANWWLRIYQSERKPNSVTPSGGQKRRISERTFKSSTGVKVDQLLERAGQLTYVYVLQEHWEHEIVLQEVIRDYTSSYPFCTAGEGACPPEGLGGAVQYMDFLKAWCDPLEKSHGWAVAWANRRGYCGEFDRAQANQFLHRKLPMGKDRIDKYVLELTSTVFETWMPVAFKSRVDSAVIAQVPLIRSFLDLLLKLKEQGSLNVNDAIEKDNYHVCVVMELKCSGYDCLSPGLALNGHKDDNLLVREPYNLATVGGFVREQNDQLVLTTKGAKAMEGSPVEAYFALLTTLVREYREIHNREPRVLEPVLLGHLLKFLHKYGVEERHVEFYTELLLEVDPYLVHDYPEDWERGCVKNYLSHKIFWHILRQGFDLFGLTKTKSWREEGSTWEIMKVRKTELLDKILDIW